MWENDDGGATCQTSPGVLTEKFAELLKTVVVHLINHALHDCWKQDCYGCQINHPSQKHHSCVRPIPGCYYQDNYGKIVAKLWNGRFTNAITSFLNANGVYGTGGRVQGASEMILNELKHAENIHNKINEMYENIMGDWYKNTTLDLALRTWSGQ